MKSLQLARFNSLVVTALVLSACSSSSTTQINQSGSDAGATGGLADKGGASSTGGKSSTATAATTSIAGASTVGGATYVETSTTPGGGTDTAGGTTALGSSSAALGGSTGNGGTSAIGGGTPGYTGGVPGTGGSKTAVGGGNTTTGGATPVSTSTGGTPGTSTGGTHTGGATSAGGTSTTGGTKSTGGTSTSGVATGGAATGGAATGGRATGGAATGGAATGGTTSDTTPPTVTSVSPLNGTQGITSSATITLNFSEPMDKTSVASALTISGLVASDMSLSWNSAGTTLTITPVSGLAYATGQSPGIAATTYTITVGTSARDAAGNTMATAFSSNFKTLRRIKYDFSPETILASDTYMNPLNSCANPLMIGGWSGSYSGGSYIAYLVFDVSPIGPASAMYAVESALLTGHQTSPTGSFYSISKVHVNKIQYYPSLYNIQSYEVLADVGILASSYASVSTLEALPSFKTDFVTNAVTKHMYTIAPVDTTWPSGDTAANFTCLGFYLTITYVIQ